MTLSVDDDGPGVRDQSYDHACGQCGDDDGTRADTHRLLPILTFTFIILIGACATDGPCIGFGTSCGKTPDPMGPCEGCQIVDSGDPTIYAKGDAQ